MVLTVNVSFTGIIQFVQSVKPKIMKIEELKHYISILNDLIDEITD